MNEEEQIKAFEIEWELIKPVLSKSLTDGMYTLREDNIKLLCRGFFTIGMLKASTSLLNELGKKL